MSVISLQLRMALFAVFCQAGAPRRVACSSVYLVSKL